MKPRRLHLLSGVAAARVMLVTLSAAAEKSDEARFTEALNVTPAHISTDRTVKYDYDIVHVGAPKTTAKR